jgi:hypothetical protein
LSVTLPVKAPDTCPRAGRKREELTGKMRFLFWEFEASTGKRKCPAGKLEKRTEEFKILTEETEEWSRGFPQVAYIFN